MSVIINMAIFPLDMSGQSLAPYVARVLRIIKAAGLPHQLGPMGTCIEGEWAEVLHVVDECYRELERDCDRIYLNITADSRRSRRDGLTTKVASVLSQSGDPIE